MFKVNQKVWCAMFGEGVVTRININEEIFVVEVTFNCDKYVSYTSDGKFQSFAMQTLFPYPVEIVKKVTKPIINWKHVHSRYNYLAMDAGGGAWLYSEEPVIEDNDWEGGFDYAEANSYASYTPGTCDWKESLVKRPD